MSRISSMWRQVAVMAAVSILALAACAALAVRAEAGVKLVPDSFVADSYEIDGTTVDHQAGSHPVSAVTAFEIEPGDGATTLVSGAARDIEVRLPEGFVGYPQDTPKCSRGEFDALVADTGKCPAAAQVGEVDTVVAQWDIANGVPSSFAQTYSLYNVDPRPGYVADLGFVVGPTPVHIEVKVDPATNALVAQVHRLSRGAPALRSKVMLWGVPSDPRYDQIRGCGDRLRFFWCPVQVDRKAFVANPSECGPAKSTSITMDSWEEPGVFDSATFTPSSGIEGCDALEFDPSIDVAPTTTAPDSPSGLSVDLTLPQNDDPDGLGTPPLRTAKVTLPEGMTINPASADGLQACSDEQLGLGTAREVSCPDGSKIGSVTAVSPSLADPVRGSVYLRSQASSDPQSGDMFRLAMVLKQPERGVLVKLAGEVRADPQTGRLETTFEDNPQLPVSSIELDLKSGPRAPLSTPATCGTKTTDVELSSWGGQQVHLTDSFVIPCPVERGFAPGFEAGSVNPTGGAFSPFVARISRPDGQQFLSGVQVDLPKGVLAKLAGVPVCGSLQAEQGGCPAGSKVGTATVGAGSGSNPFYVRGDVFLTEGYKGAPYGLATHVHATAGPFDLGWVRVRQALYVDPETAEVRVVSDPLPQIVSGVPVRLRSVSVDVDRPGFAINPTSCAEKQAVASFASVDGATSRSASRFQAGDCQALSFKPRLGMRLTGKGQTKTGSHPGLTTTVTQAKGQAGIAKAKVTLPRSVVLDPLNTVDPKMLCGYDEALKAECPASSVIGKAVAKTPVLNRSLAGDVHLVQGIKFGPKGNRIRTTPSLLVKLRGEVAINLRGKTSTERGTNRLVTTFGSVPDAPVSRFTLKINGGRKGILVVTRTRRSKIDICDGRQTADVQTDGHNGKQADYGTTVKTPCGAKTPRRAKRTKR